MCTENGKLLFTFGQKDPNKQHDHGGRHHIH